MKYSFPLDRDSTVTYSHKVKDYRNLTKKEIKLLVNNFVEFYKYCFWMLGLPCPTRDQLYMAKFLWKNSGKDADPMMLQAQRGLAKSLTTQLFVVWLLLRNKDEKIVVVSATGRRAESFTLFCLNLLKAIPLLNHLSPMSSDRSSANKFDVAGRTPDDSPSVIAFGVTSAKTGSRATFIVYDDVEIPENSMTSQMREKLLAGVRDTANLGISGIFRELCICTPQSSESVYNTMCDEDGFTKVVLPAEYPEDIDVYQGCLAPHIERIARRFPHRVGTNTDARQNMAHLMKQKMKGKSRYKLQYMLDTTLSDAERYPLKLSDMIVTDLDDKYAPVHIEYGSEKKNILYDIKHSGFRGDYLFSPRYISDGREEYESVMMFVDPAGRGEDETAYCVTATLRGMIFLLDFGGIKGGYENSSLITLARIAKRFNANGIQVESNFGDGAFAELLKPVISRYYKNAYRDGDKGFDTSGVLIEDVRATKQKEVRVIETLEPILNQHRLVVSRQALLNDADKDKAEYRFTHQLTHITLEKGCLKHDDIVDVVQLGVKYWQDTMARDTEEELKRFEQEQIQKELEMFLNDMIDLPKKGNVSDNY